MSRQINRRSSSSKTTIPATQPATINATTSNGLPNHLSRASRNNEKVPKNLPNASNRPSTLNATTSNDLLVESSQSSGTNATTINYLPNRHRATVS